MRSENLHDYAKLFSASQRLASVGAGLASLLKGEPVDKDRLEHFEWVKQLTEQMDFDSEQYKKREHPELTIIATELRPLFYERLIVEEVASPDFCRKLYTTLGSEGKDVPLTPRELGQASRIYEEMSNKILLRPEYCNGIKYGNI